MIAAASDDKPSEVFPADELQQRHPELYMNLRMAVIQIRGDKRPKDYSIDLILKTLAPLLKEEFNVGIVED